MTAARKLRGASLSALLASFLAMNCGEQEFNLLPLEQENARGGSTTGGEDGTGGTGATGGLISPPPPETGGASTGGRWSSGGRGPTGGASPTGGRGSAPCDPPVCCTSSEDCTDERRPFCLATRVCAECYRSLEDGRPVGCAPNEACADSFRCVQSCLSQPCPGDLKCDPVKLQCVECLEHADCSQNENRKLCFGNYCVVCRTSADCPAFMTCNAFYTCV